MPPPTSQEGNVSPAAPLAARPAPALAALPVLYTVCAMFMFPTGASVAKGLFPHAGPAGVASLRLCCASVLMLFIWRPWRTPLRRDALRYIVAYGVVLGTMNLTFYSAISRIPLGIAVAIEFLGPLVLALLHSRNRLDILWVLCAAGGVYLLLPLHTGGATLDPLGIAFALLAGVCWAVYIVCAQKAGTGGQAHAAAYGSIVASLVIVPFGVAYAGRVLLELRVLELAVVVATLSSAIPYSLEMIALGRLPARTFGILMSLEPAVASLTGFLLLHERLSAVQVIAIALVTLASGGSVATRGAQETATVAPGP